MVHSLNDLNVPQWKTQKIQQLYSMFGCKVQFGYVLLLYCTLYQLLIAAVFTITDQTLDISCFSNSLQSKKKRNSIWGLQTNIRAKRNITLIIDLLKETWWRISAGVNQRSTRSTSKFCCDHCSRLCCCTALVGEGLVAEVTALP